ncbi:MAG: MBL fold metallo-hydrolase [Gemmatimonadota bacterium]
MKALGRKAAGERLARMQASTQWRGNSFANVDYQPPTEPRTSFSLMDFFCPHEERKPRAPLPTLDPRERWRTPPETGLRVTWLGHSTLFLEIDGVRVLIDPVWGSRASPSRRVGPRRFQPPPVPLAALPSVDLVLLSHDHYDHLDYPTIRTLASTQVPFLAPLGVGAHLEHWGVRTDRITEVDWWERFTVPGSAVDIIATPAQHFSGRTPGSRNHTLWASYVIESPKHCVYHGADSGLMPAFKTIGERFGPFDLVCLEIGAYHPAWGDIHLGPVNALTAWKALGGGPLLPIHWGTFALAMHRWDDPIEELVAGAGAAGADLLTPRLGEPLEPARDTGVRPWWREVAALHGPVEERNRSATEDSAEVPEPID